MFRSGKILEPNEHCTRWGGKKNKIFKKKEGGGHKKEKKEEKTSASAGFCLDFFPFFCSCCFVPLKIAQTKNQQL